MAKKKSGGMVVPCLKPCSHRFEGRASESPETSHFRRRSRSIYAQMPELATDSEAPRRQDEGVTEIVAGRIKLLSSCSTHVDSCLVHFHDL